MGRGRLAVALSLMTFFSSITFAYGASIEKIDNKSISTSYSYVAERENAKDKSIKEKIDYEGRTYALKDVDIRAKKLTVTEKVVSKNKEDYPKSIKKKIGGKEFTFTAESNINWKEKGKKINVERVKEYETRGEIPNSIKEGDLTLSLNNVSSSSRVESFNAPAEFISYMKNADVYFFNGKEVKITGEPVWDTYKSDVADYLGATGTEYDINGGYWNSDSILEDEAENRYIRTATFTGTKVVPFFVAQYSYSGDDPKDIAYEADVVYTADKGYEITAKAIYEKNISLKTVVIMVGAGILVISVAVAVIIALLKRKRRKEDDQ